MTRSSLDQGGMTALMGIAHALRYASFLLPSSVERYVQAISLLVQAGADKSIKDKAGLTAFDYATSSNATDAVKSLLRT